MARKRNPLPSVQGRLRRPGQDLAISTLYRHPHRAAQAPPPPSQQPPPLRVDPQRGQHDHSNLKQHPTRLYAGSIAYQASIL